MADALAHAHARLIVHRDVKPANIILTPDRGPVLVDFGLGLDEAEAGGSELGVISGTPAYMAPEQVAGTAHRIDGRTDIYSLGVVLYEMLCGRLPFRAANLCELLRQVRDDEPQPPRQLAREIPPELERVCLKALAKRQQDRYTTAADFADDLRRVLPGRGGAERVDIARLPRRSRYRPARPRASLVGPLAAVLPDVDLVPAPRPRGRAPAGDRPGLRMRPVRVRGVPGGPRRGGPGQDAAGLPAGLRAGRVPIRRDGRAVQRAGAAGLLRLPGGLRGRRTPRRTGRPRPPRRPEGPRRAAPPRTQRWS